MKGLAVLEIVWKVDAEQFGPNPAYIERHEAPPEITQATELYQLRVCAEEARDAAREVSRGDGGLDEAARKSMRELGPDTKMNVTLERCK